jgi:hypothetical protein
LLVGSRDAAAAACPVTGDCDFSVFLTAVEQNYNHPVFIFPPPFRNINHKVMGSWGALL